jgi:NADH:ubiquinone oxidoreductase subunit 5 (chain L)/Multisubunit Na+/H+ antiporter, MnhA subunit
MYILLLLLTFPFLAAVLLLLVRNDNVRSGIVKASAAIIILLSVLLVIQYYGKGTVFFDVGDIRISYIMLGIELIMSAVLFYLGIKYRKYFASVLAVIQAIIMLWYEQTIGHDIDISHNMYVDGLSLIMVLVIGVVGSLIILYAVGYMKDYQSHHSEQPDRRHWFFFLMFMFLSAMFGIVLCNNMIWMLFFWEITTICSFLLIGYTRTKEAVNNSFKQLTMNLLGGTAFALAIVALGMDLKIAELDVMIDLGINGTNIMLPAVLLVFAGIVKAAQMPFHSWLLGAMVAPTPTSALLHSSTMVKAGVFLIIKLSPVMGLNEAGIMAMSIGGITFLLASMAAISQSNAKRVLAYSTVANLGLIIACAGVGTAEAVWVAIMLLIFHAVTKSLLFLCVGTAEHNIGSRDIESMDGLFSRMPRLALLMMIGIIGMFLAPFGMLIAKWGAMASFIESQNLFLIICVCFGSAVTVFYWSKWLGKMSAVVGGSENIEGKVHKEEWFTESAFAVLAVALCIMFPIISTHAIVPILEELFGVVGPSIALSTGNLYIMSAMMVAVILMPLLLLRTKKKTIKPIYTCGIESGDNRTYSGAMGKEVTISLRNWYMEEWFSENRISKVGVVIATVMIIGITLYTMISAGGVV